MCSFPSLMPTKSSNIDVVKRNKRKETTMIKTNDIIINKGSYENTYEATYENNAPISTNEAENIMNKHYRMFPITKSSYSINGNTMTIKYTMDSCD